MFNSIQKSQYHLFFWILQICSFVFILLLKQNMKDSVERNHDLFGKGL